MTPEGGTCGEARDRSGVFLKPEQLHGRESPHEQGREWRMPQKTRVVGLDVAKSKVDACIRSAGLRLSAPSTPEGEAELVAWLRANRVGRAVMEASGGYERSWAEALRAAGVEVRIVDPKRIRHFAKAAGRLAKNDPIDAETIAWFAEAFPDGRRPTARSRARGGRPAGSGPGGLERRGRSDQATGRASPAGRSSPRPWPRSPRRCGPNCASSRP